MRSVQNPKLTRAPLFWLLALLLVAAPYQTGLFFEREWLYTYIFSALLILLGVFTRGKGLGFFRNPLDWAALGLLLAYVAGALTAVSARSAVTEVLKYIDLLAVYWLIAYGGWSRRDFKALLLLIFWSGFGVALLGILTAVGIYPLVGGYLDGRIYSTFQYANTLAAFLDIMILFGIYLWVETKSVFRHLYLPALYLILACLVGTGSRGGMGTLALSIPVFLWCLPPSSRRLYLGRLLWCLVPGALGSIPFIKFLSDNSQTAVQITLVAIVCSGTLISVLRERIPRLRAKWLLLAIGVGAAIVLLLVFSLKGGVENPLIRLRTATFKAHEFQARLIYYRDSLDMVADRPLQGFGGGGWALYPRYQDYNYLVSDPHSQPVKVAVESGLFGLLCYLAWWILLSRRALSKVRQGDTMLAVLFVGLLALGIHSLIDFDLSFGAVGFLLWAGAGIIHSEDSPAEKRNYPLLLAAGLAALVLGTAGISFLQAAEKQGWSTFYIQQGRYEEALKSLQQARQFDPFSAGFPASQAELYSGSGPQRDQAKAQEAIAVAQRLDSADANIKRLARNILFDNGRLTEAAAAAEDYLAFNSLAGDAYLDLANFYQNLADKALEQGKRDQAKEFLLRGSAQAQNFQRRLTRIPAWESSLWLGAKPAVSTELTQKCQALKNRAAEL